MNESKIGNAREERIMGGIKQKYRGTSTPLGPLYRELSDSHTITLAGEKLKQMPQINEYKHPNVQHLDLSNNEISNLGPLPLSLTSLNMAHNKMIFVGRIDDYIPHLEDIDLSHNRIIALDNIAQCHLLKSINLGYNCLPKEEIATLDALNALKTLNLTSNNLNQSILPIILNIPYLENLTLDQNQILELNLRKGMNKLLSLSVNNNSLSHIRILDELPKLRILQAKGNHIQAISGLTFIPNVVELYLDHNCLKNIDHVAGLRRLERLTISHNSLTKVNLRTENERRSPIISFLDISHNSIQDFSFIAELKRLLHLQISDNSITHIPSNLIGELGALPLEHLNICKNKLTHLNNISGLAQLQYLNISNNKLKYLSHELSSLIYLKFLDFTNNKNVPNIKDVQGRLYAELPNLKTIKCGNTLQPSKSPHDKENTIKTRIKSENELNSENSKTKTPSINVIENETLTSKIFTKQDQNSHNSTLGEEKMNRLLPSLLVENATNTGNYQTLGAKERIKEIINNSSKSGDSVYRNNIKNNVLKAEYKKFEDAIENRTNSRLNLRMEKREDPIKNKSTEKGASANTNIPVREAIRSTTNTPKLEFHPPLPRSKTPDTRGANTRKRGAATTGKESHGTLGKINTPSFSFSKGSLGGSIVEESLECGSVVQGVTFPTQGKNSLNSSMSHIPHTSELDIDISLEELSASQALGSVNYDTNTNNTNNTNNMNNMIHVDNNVPEVTNNISDILEIAELAPEVPNITPTTTGTTMRIEHKPLSSILNKRRSKTGSPSRGQHEETKLESLISPSRRRAVSPINNLRKTLEEDLISLKKKLQSQLVPGVNHNITDTNNNNINKLNKTEEQLNKTDKGIHFSPNQPIYATIPYSTPNNYVPHTHNNTHGHGEPRRVGEVVNSRRDREQRMSTREESQMSLLEELEEINRSVCLSNKSRMGNLADEGDISNISNTSNISNNSNTSNLSHNQVQTHMHHSHMHSHISHMSHMSHMSQLSATTFNSIGVSTGRQDEVLLKTMDIVNQMEEEEGIVFDYSKLGGDRREYYPNYMGISNTELPYTTGTTGTTNTELIHSSPKSPKPQNPGPKPRIEKRGPKKSEASERKSSVWVEWRKYKKCSSRGKEKEDVRTRIRNSTRDTSTRATTTPSSDLNTKRKEPHPHTLREELLRYNEPAIYGDCEQKGPMSLTYEQKPMSLTHSHTPSISATSFTIADIGNMPLIPKDINIEADKLFLELNENNILTFQRIRYFLKRLALETNLEISNFDIGMILFELQNMPDRCILGLTKSQFDMFKSSKSFKSKFKCAEDNIAKNRNNICTTPYPVNMNNMSVCADIAKDLKSANYNHLNKSMILPREVAGEKEVKEKVDKLLNKSAYYNRLLEEEGVDIDPMNVLNINNSNKGNKLRDTNEEYEEELQKSMNLKETSTFDIQNLNLQSSSKFPRSNSHNNNPNPRDSINELKEYDESYTRATTTTNPSKRGHVREPTFNPIVQHINMEMEERRSKSAIRSPAGVIRKVSTLRGGINPISISSFDERKNSILELPPNIDNIDRGNNLLKVRYREINNRIKGNCSLEERLKDHGRYGSKSVVGYRTGGCTTPGGGYRNVVNNGVGDRDPNNTHNTHKTPNPNPNPKPQSYTEICSPTKEYFNNQGGMRSVFSKPKGYMRSPYITAGSLKVNLARPCTSHCTPFPKKFWDTRSTSPNLNAILDTRLHSLDVAALTHEQQVDLLLGEVANPPRPILSTEKNTTIISNLGVGTQEYSLIRNLYGRPADCMNIQLAKIIKTYNMNIHKQFWGTGRGTDQYKLLFYANSLDSLAKLIENPWGFGALAKTAPQQLLFSENLSISMSYFLKQKSQNMKKHWRVILAAVSASRIWNENRSFSGFLINFDKRAGLLKKNGYTAIYFQMENFYLLLNGEQAIPLYLFEYNF